MSLLLTLNIVLDNVEFGQVKAGWECSAFIIDIAFLVSFPLFSHTKYEYCYIFDYMWNNTGTDYIINCNFRQPGIFA